MLSGALAQAAQFHREGNLSAAEQRCRQVLQANPGYANAWYLLGLVQRDRRCLGDAVQSFLKALAREPRSVVCLSVLGTVYQQLGRLVEAEAIFQKALRIEPLSAEVLNHLSFTQRAM